MSKERLEKSERTPPVSWRPWVLAYSRDQQYIFSCLSAVSKNGRFSVFSWLWGVIWRGNAFRDQQCQFRTGNKSLSSENESKSSMTSECVRTGSILPRGTALEHARCKQPIFSLLIFGMLVERLSFLRLHFCSDFVTVFFLFSSSMQGLKYHVTDFLISTCEQSYASSKPTEWGKTAFFEVFRPWPYLDF